MVCLVYRCWLFCDCGFAVCGWVRVISWGLLLGLISCLGCLVLCLRGGGFCGGFGADCYLFIGLVWVMGLVRLWLAFGICVWWLWV